MQNALTVVRHDLYVLPKLGEMCFYGNPLKNLARNVESSNPSDLCIDFPSGMWRFLTNFRSNNSKDPNFFEILETLNQDRLRLMVLWEWLWSSRSQNSLDRLMHFEKLNVRLMQGYIVTMRRALQTAGLHAQDIPEDCFPKLRLAGVESEVYKPVNKANTAGKDYYDFYLKHKLRNPAVQIMQAPLHIALLLNETAAVVKGDDVQRGSREKLKIMELQAQSKESDLMPVRRDTVLGLRLRNLPNGCKNQVSLNDGWGSVTARLLVAVAIENWLDQSDDFSALLNAAMGRSV